MTPLSFALCLTYLYFGRLAQTTDVKSSTYVHQRNGSISANVGDNVTLQCFYEGDAVMFYWYKQTLGDKPKVISTFYKHEISGTFYDEFKIPRFSLDTGKGKNHLTIFDLEVSDSATYYCTGSYEYDLEFVEGCTISVKGSGFDVKALVLQSASETIQPAGSVTCTVHTGTYEGNHSVYWFRNSEESHPGLIYNHEGRNDQCVYNLPTETLNLSHSGTDYCAVATCGHILFGIGKKLDTMDEVDSFVLVHFLIGALAFNTALLVLLAYVAYTINKRHCCQCTDSRSSAASSPNAVDYEDTDNIHYAALRVQKAKNRSTRRMDDTLSECVYSGVRQ
uniref:immunoglobulin kappa light chain-like n=1 Tax=Semicossyphus pulcher TaxID=241346 RepID=UPI0037E92BEE